jgi:hypothetical protein
MGKVPPLKKYVALYGELEIKVEATSKENARVKAGIRWQKPERSWPKIEIIELPH